MQQRIHTKTTDKTYTDTIPVVSRCLRRRRMMSRSYNGAQLDVGLWSIHTRAKIGGVRFTSGHSLLGGRRKNEKMKRCGSVITLIRGGRSLYARVIRFMNFDRLNVEHVSWLPVPDYPTGSPVVVRVVNDNPKPNEECIVSLTDVDPSPVTMLHEETCMYMLRMNGIDTMPGVRL